jgi:hypothetical protein
MLCRVGVAFIERRLSLLILFIIFSKFNNSPFYLITGDYTKFRLQGPYLVLSKEIDVDTEPNVWSLTVVVRDRGNPRLSTLIDIVIYVEGVDDNAPVWAPPENGKYVIGKLNVFSVIKLCCQYRKWTLYVQICCQ